MIRFSQNGSLQKASYNILSLNKRFLMRKIRLITGVQTSFWKIAETRLSAKGHWPKTIFPRQCLYSALQKIKDKFRK